MLAPLLEDIPLAGTLVSVDALHTQADTARHLVQERGADYPLTVKNNQPALREACERLLPDSSFPHAHKQGEKNGGRIETRKVVARAVEPGELPFPHVSQVARIERRRGFVDGRVQEETVYVISSSGCEKLGEKALAAAQRAHWGIENGLDRRRDHAYDEDRHHMVERGTAQVMASLRNLSIAV